MPVRNNKPVILIADDEPNILKFLAYNVKALGYDTVEVQDGTACIKKIKSNEITGLLLDINMPKRTGMEVLAFVRENRPSIPVIMVTAAYEIDTAVTAIKMGAFEYLTKPVDLDRLATTLKGALRQVGGTRFRSSCVAAPMCSAPAISACSRSSRRVAFPLACDGSKR